MTEKEFSEKILKVSLNHWKFVLAGTRNLGFQRASLVSHLLSTDVVVWIDSTRVDERKKAWEIFSA